MGITQAFWDVIDSIAPPALEDTLSPDTTEALPTDDVVWIGLGDYVDYEWVNEDGAVMRRFSGRVVKVDYANNGVWIRTRDGALGWVTYWAPVEFCSLVTSKAAALTAEAMKTAV